MVQDRARHAHVPRLDVGGRPAAQDRRPRVRVRGALPPRRLVLLAPLPQGRRRADRRDEEGDGGDRRQDPHAGAGLQLVVAGRAGAPRPRAELAAAAGDRRGPGVPDRQLRAVGRPEPARRLRARVLRVDGGADPRLRAARDRPQPRGAPVRLLRDQRRRRADHPRAQQAVGELRVLRAARLPPLRRGGRRAADDGVRRARSCSTCTSRTATTTGRTSATATSSTRPASTPGSTSTTRSATAR